MAGRPKTCSSATSRPSAMAATRKSPGSVAARDDDRRAFEHFEAVLGQRVVADRLARVHRIAAKVDGDPGRDQRVADAERARARAPGQRLAPPLRAVAAIERPDDGVQRREVDALVVGDGERRSDRSPPASASARDPACRPGNRSGCRWSRRTRVRRAERWSRCCRRGSGSRSPCRWRRSARGPSPSAPGRYRRSPLMAGGATTGAAELLAPDLGPVGAAQGEDLAGIEGGDDPARARHDGG